MRITNLQRIWLNILGLSDYRVNCRRSRRSPRADTKPALVNAFLDQEHKEVVLILARDPHPKEITSDLILRVLLKLVHPEWTSQQIWETSEKLMKARRKGNLKETAAQLGLP